VRRAIGLLRAAAALAVAAVAIPSPALMPAAVALPLVALSAWAVAALAARRIVVTRSVPVREAREDEPLGVRFAVAGLGRLPVSVSARTSAGAWTPLGPHGGELELAIGRRGAYRLGPSSLRVRDALGIVERRVRVGPPEPLLILPAPDAGLLAAPRGAGGAAGEPEPDGLRPYAPGTPLTRIHWPALARGAGLHARSVAPGSDDLPLVIVDTAGSPEPQAVDWAARAAAGHILRLFRAGGCRVALPGDRTPRKVTRPAEWRAMQRRLALLQPAAALAPAVHTARAIRVCAAAVALATLEPTPELPPGVEPDAGRR
jgi:uncharacterized protein (DUF58 family)